MSTPTSTATLPPRTTTTSRSRHPVRRPVAPGGPALFTVLSADRYTADLARPDGEPERWESSSLVDLMLRTAAARHLGGGARRPARPAPSPTLFVVRAAAGTTAEEHADRVTRQLALAAQGLDVAARLLEDAGAPVRWPEAFGARRLPVPGSPDAFLWSPPDTPRALVLAGSGNGGPAWAATVRGVVARHAPDRVAVAALDALGRDACDVAAVLRPVRQLLVRGQALHPWAYGPFLDLLRQERRRPPAARPRRTRRGRHTAAPTT